MRQPAVTPPCAEVLLALRGPEPDPREQWANKTTEEIMAEIRAMLAKMPDLPFPPETATIVLPSDIGRHPSFDLRTR